MSTAIPRSITFAHLHNLFGGTILYFQRCHSHVLHLNAPFVNIPVFISSSAGAKRKLLHNLYACTGDNLSI